MTLSIRDPDTDARARRLARRTGKPITTVVRDALVAYEGTLPVDDAEFERRMAAIREIQDRIRRAPVLDPRSPQEIMDDLYDENGLPK